MSSSESEEGDRRAFLKTCGRFAAVTPPVMTLLLSTSLTSNAIARSGGRDGARHDDDRSQSFSDNDLRSAPTSGTSGGGSFGGDGSPGASRGGSPGEGVSGGAGAGGGGTGGKGPFATGGSSGNISASGNLDCADDGDERKRKFDCPRADVKVSSSTGSAH